MKVWRLKKGGDRRLRAGHPWVFTGEVAHSTKEVTPGEIVEVRDSSDHFLAYGYAHPSSQICFRKLTGHSREKDLLSVDFFRRRIRSAFNHRARAGWTDFSFRLLFAEADGVPGLVVDLYCVSRTQWIAVVQASTAGMDRALTEVFEALKLELIELGELTIVESPSSRARAAEGLKIREKEVVFGHSRDAFDGRFLFVGDTTLRVDLIHGQKTGFFLDQQWNVGLLKTVLPKLEVKPSEEIKVLDLCCYVGQWGSHVAHSLMKLGRRAQVTLVDSSESALSFAKHNVAQFSGSVEAIQGDVLKDLERLEKDSFDVVICDPPAFVKKKADLEAGLRAYSKLNRSALRLLKPGGLFVASSCSGLVRYEPWREVLAEAGVKSGRVLRQLLAGGHGPDHPVRPEFPEGEYLKCQVFSVSSSF